MTINTLLILRGQSWYSEPIGHQKLWVVSRYSNTRDKLNLQGFRIVKLIKK